jgi:hypothetical protein
MALKNPEWRTETTLPAIIPDLSLLLTVWGPWFVRHLSRSASVWLPRAIVRLRAGEALLIDNVIDQQVLDLWEDCWPGLVQQHRVHWFDQDIIQSHAPKGKSPALLDRLNNLAAELHERMQAESNPPDVEPLSLMLEGVVTTVALAAALDEPAIVLCHVADNQGEPYLCEALKRFNLTPSRLDGEGIAQTLSARLVDGLVQVGIGPLLAAKKLRLAALYVAMPRSELPLPPASSAPSMLNNDEPSEEELGLNGLCSLIEQGRGPFWNDVVVVWHEVR